MFFPINLKFFIVSAKHKGKLGIYFFYKSNYQSVCTSNLALTKVLESNKYIPEMYATISSI